LVKKETKPLFNVEPYGILFNVCKLTEYDFGVFEYEKVDTFDELEKANKHCELLNKQNEDRINEQIKETAEYRFEKQEILNKANRVLDLCVNCFYFPEWCPINKRNRIKLIEGLSCKRFHLQ